MIARSIRTIVIDDESLARTRITRLLQDRDGYEVVGEFGNARDGLLALRELDPDLVFLDIQMPDMTGFELLESLTHDSPPAVIFVTAHSEHALRAFEFNAVDYLLKPFDDERFERTVARATNTLLNQDAVSLRRELKRLVESHWLNEQDLDSHPRLSHAGRDFDRIMVRDGDRIFFQRVSEIDWIEAADYNVRIHVGSQEHVMRDSLTNLEEKLDPGRFARIHRSVIVNIERIAELQPYFNGAYIVVLEDGTELKLSRRRRQALEDLLGRSL